MIYILDTDIFTLTELPDSPEYLRLHARILQLSSNDKVVTTIITYEEQTRGWLSYAKRKLELEHQIKAYSRLKQHLRNYLEWELLDFDSRAAEEFRRLRALKIRIGTADLKIASITLSQNAFLLTRNLSDFCRVSNLRAEDWTSH